MKLLFIIVFVFLRVNSILMYFFSFILVIMNGLCVSILIKWLMLIIFFKYGIEIELRVLENKGLLEIF